MQDGIRIISMLVLDIDRIQNEMSHLIALQGVELTPPPHTVNLLWNNSPFLFASLHSHARLSQDTFKAFSLTSSIVPSSIILPEKPVSDPISNTPVAPTAGLLTQEAVVRHLGVCGTCSSASCACRLLFELGISGNLPRHEMWQIMSITRTFEGQY